MKKLLAIVLALTLVASLSGVALANNGDGSILLSTHTYGWTDTASGQTIEITENVYEKADGDYRWEYVVENINYDPDPPYTNGLAGFQIVFPDQVAEVANQMSPAIGGPWEQNAYSGTAPPWGVEWDAPLPGVGIMPGQIGVFSFDTSPRMDGIQATPASWAHTWGLPIPEPIIDLDGTLTSGPGGSGDQQVMVLDPLIGWAPFGTSGPNNEGIDWFDNDGDRLWTWGLDDIHCEDPATHPGAIRDAIHDPTDPMVIDNSGLAPGTPVDVDLEANLDFTGVGGVDPAMKFRDSNGDLGWTDGEDIVLDVNLDGIFGEVLNTQTYIFYGRHSVPGSLIPLLVDKVWKYTDVCFELDNDGDGQISEDPIDFDIDGNAIDNDGDGLYNEDPSECPDGTSLGTELTQVNGVYQLEAVVKKNDRVSSYNPGQFYAVSRVEVLDDLDKLVITEDFSDPNLGDIAELNPKKGGGKVVVVEMWGAVPVQILDAMDDEVEVVAGIATVTLQNVSAGSVYLVYVKFAPGLDDINDNPGEPSVNYNVAEATVGDFSGSGAASAMIEVVNLH